MLKIVFEIHASSLDNEAGLASGHYDVELLPTGEKQARELGRRYRHGELKAVYCSDLRRSYRTAKLAFESRDLDILRDPRLREYDYGKLTRQPREAIEAVRARHMEQPFPGGASYRQAVMRLQSALSDMCEYDEGFCMLIIGHRATQYGLEHWLKGVPLVEAVRAPWVWQPSWEHRLEELPARRPPGFPA